MQGKRYRLVAGDITSAPVIQVKAGRPLVLPSCTISGPEGLKSLAPKTPVSPHSRPLVAIAQPVASGSLPQSAKGRSTGGSRRTGASAAKAASKVLRDGRTSKASKTAAASALSQRAPKRKG
jgi:hypothetical protein